MPPPCCSQARAVAKQAAPATAAIFHLFFVVEEIFQERGGGLALLLNSWNWIRVDFLSILLCHQQGTTFSHTQFVATTGGNSRESSSAVLELFCCLREISCFIYFILTCGPTVTEIRMLEAARIPLVPTFSLIFHRLGILLPLACSGWNFAPAKLPLEPLT